MPADHYKKQLEELEEPVVRVRLEIGDGADILIPYDEAKAWLAEKEERARKRAETLRYWAVLIAAIVSAVAAIVAALPVLKSWF